MFNLIADLSLDSFNLNNLKASFLLVEQQLLNLASSPDLSQKLTLAFGKSFNLAEAWQNGDFNSTVQVLTSEELNGANGAFSIQTNTIYVSKQFIETNGVEALAGLLLEEIGHKIDSVVNEVDSEGDEGAIFAA